MKAAFIKQPFSTGGVRFKPRSRKHHEIPRDLRMWVSTIYSGNAKKLGTVYSDPMPFFRDFLSNVQGKDCRVVITNGVGTGFGDIISGTPMLRAAHETIVRAKLRPHIELVVEPNVRDRYEWLLTLCPYVDKVWPASMPIGHWQTFHFHISTEMLLANPLFHHMHMTDFFLHCAHLPDVEDKQPEVYIRPQCIEDVAKLHRPDRPVCLLNFWATALRRIPKNLWTPLAKSLLDHFTVVCATSAPHIPELKEWIAESGLPVLDLSNMSSCGVDYLWAMICMFADVVVTPDTCLVHACGALDAPCVALFYSIDPDLRVRYYPTVSPIEVDPEHKGKFWGESKGHVPEGEHTMENVAAWHKPWKSFKVRTVVERAVEIAKAPQDRHPRPVGLRGWDRRKLLEMPPRRGPKLKQVI